MKKTAGDLGVLQKVLDLRGIKCECVNWNNLAQQREQCQTVANIAINDLKFSWLIVCGTM